MRHRKAGRKLNRTSSHRKAMFSNMCCSLIEHELIKTTLPKAKELRRYIEPLITTGKTDSVASRRKVFDKIRSKSAVGKLFTNIGPRYKERPGGYVRVLKCGYRPGDNAPMAIIELVDRPSRDEIDATESQKKVKPKKTDKAAKVIKADKKEVDMSDKKSAKTKASAPKKETKSESKKD